MDVNYPEYLYHYCSFDAFKGIMINRCIRFSDLLTSNDNQEDKLVLAALKHILDKKESSYRNNALCEMERARARTKVLGFCLSGKGNSRKMYDKYAKGNGVILEFDTYKLLSFFNEIEPYAGEKLSFKKVTYICSQSDEEDLEEKLTKILDGESNDFINNRLPSKTCFEFILQESYFYKGKTWKNEDEYRAAFRLLFSDEILNGDYNINNSYAETALPFVTFENEQYHAIPDISKCKFYIDVPINMDLIHRILVPKEVKDTFNEKMSVVDNYFKPTSIDISDLEKKINSDIKLE